MSKIKNFLAEVSVDEATLRDVKPDDCGTVDGSWFIGRCADGRWLAVTDEVDQDPMFFESEAEAEAYWDDAAQTQRSIRS